MAIVIQRYKKLFSEDVYRDLLTEADDDADTADTSEEDTSETSETEDTSEEGQDPAEDTQEAPAEEPTADDTALDDTASLESQPQDIETDEEEQQKEIEKEEELETQGTISNIFSEIADKISESTLKYYTIVEEHAADYMNSLKNLSNEEKKELLRDFPAVGVKILDMAKRNNFIDKNHIAYAAIMEANIEIMKKLEYDEDEVSPEINK